MKKAHHLVHLSAQRQLGIGLERRLGPLSLFGAVPGVMFGKDHG
jgi:hypothetical protein